MLIACVVGARPNFVKIAPLITEMRRQKIDYWLIHTGQHYDHGVSQVFFEDLEIPPPDTYLGVGSGTHGKQTGLALIKLEEEFIKVKPDLVVVVGDVNSTLAGALAAAKLHIPVAHVEAGYRSFDRRMPEEINRVLVDHIAQFLFAPTQDAVENLRREGIHPSRIFYVGNIMAETLLRNLEKIKLREKHKEFDLQPRKYALATIHRPENTDNISKLKRIVSAFSNAPLPVVFPLHPRTERMFDEFGLRRLSKGHLIVTKAFSYLDMLSMLQNAHLVLTDSGGVQEEACVLRVPCITIRESTERIATIAAGANRLTKAERRQILTAITEIVENGVPSWVIPDRWDREVSKRIVCVLKRSFSNVQTGKSLMEGSKWN